MDIFTLYNILEIYIRKLYVSDIFSVSSFSSLSHFFVNVQILS